MAFIKVKDLEFRYNTSKTPILKNVNFDISEGEFVAIVGESGSGKSTLLKLLKEEVRPFGELKGDMVVPQNIGFLFQDVDSQMVADKVYAELSFALENCGCESSMIAKKAGEVCQFFGINDLYNRDTFSLSGGQKQLINLASLCVNEPQVLLLDEPTNYLDPIARENFCNIVKKLNKELGITVIIVEHNLEGFYENLDKIILIDNGVSTFDSPENLINLPKIQNFLPTMVKIFGKIGNKIPHSLAEGRKILRENYKNSIKENTINSFESNEVLLKVKNGYFRYDKNGEDILRDINFEVKNGEFLAIVGGNGSGKSTLLKVLGGVRKLYAGKIVGLKNLKVGYLPQNPRTLFLEESVEKELICLKKLLKLEVDVKEVLKRFDLEKVKDIHPYDISGGEAQKLAIAKVFMTKIDVLLLDEPTQSLDFRTKHHLKNLLFSLKNEGITIVMVSHDLDFCTYADTCAMLFDGKIVSKSCPEKFFSDNNFYTTTTARLVKGIYEYTVNTDQLGRIIVRNGGSFE